jgi:hypothetical protein
MERVNGTAVHCSRFGCVVRLEDGRLANLAPSEPGHAAVRRALAGGKRPRFGFMLEETDGRPRLSLAPDQADDPSTDDPGSNDPRSNDPRSNGPLGPLTSSLDEKIIDYLRQTADWDPKGAIAEQAYQTGPPRADRLLPFEMRARRQYRESAKRPPHKKR